MFWPMENLLEFECWMPKRVFWRKSIFHWLFISILVNTTSVLILFELTFYICKHNENFNDTYGFLFIYILCYSPFQNCSNWYNMLLDFCWVWPSLNWHILPKRKDCKNSHTTEEIHGNLFSMEEKCFQIKYKCLTEFLW